MEKTALELYCSFPMLSLQKMSLIRITTILCNNGQLLRLIVKCNFEKHFDSRLYARQGRKWEAVQEMAIELISEICNATKLSESLLELLWPVCYRIMLWKLKYGTFIRRQFLQHFYWTDQGRLDNIRTAKHIVRNNNISLRRRFVLACSVCLDKEIHELWREFSNEDKMYFYAENREIYCPLLLFWAHVMDGTQNVLEQFLDGACLCAFEYGLLEAIKYLFTLSTKEAKNNLSISYLSKLYEDSLETFLEEDDIRIGYFLFSEMSDENRLLLFDLRGLELKLLFHYSERKHFFNVLAVKLRSASDFDIFALLHMMFFEYHFEVNKDDDCHKIFVDIWRTAPDSLKSLIAETEAGGQFLSVLIRDNFPFLLRKEAFKMMNESISPHFISSIAVTPFGFNQDKWEFLLFLVQEEVVKMSSFELFKDFNLTTMKRKMSDKGALIRVLRFMRKIGSKNRQ